MEVDKRRKVSIRLLVLIFLISLAVISYLSGAGITGFSSFSIMPVAESNDSSSELSIPVVEEVAPEPIIEPEPEVIESPPPPEEVVQQTKDRRFGVMAGGGSGSLVENNTWGWNLTDVEDSAVAWGDLDNDGDLDLVLTGTSSADPWYFSRVYINNGTSLVENSSWGSNLTGVFESSIALGDLDLDGDLDLVLTGNPADGSSDFAAVYLNNGTSLVENSSWGGNLEEVHHGSVVLGDLDLDGDLDLVLTGDHLAGTEFSAVYLNNGTSLVENSSWGGNLEDVRFSSVVLGDLDLDGDLDLVLTGDPSAAIQFSRVYINNGSSLAENSSWGGNLTDVRDSSVVLGDLDLDGDLDLVMTGNDAASEFSAVYVNNGSSLVENSSWGWNLTGVGSGSVALGDLDNDGRLDLVLTGWGSAEFSTVYLNNGSSLVENSSWGGNLTGVSSSPSVALGDVDNDGDLDLVLTGDPPAGTEFSVIYTNNVSVANSAPLPPTSGFSSSYAGSALTLSWDNGSDSETNNGSLYYNLRVGTVSGGNDTVSGVYGGSGGSAAAGYFGNMMQRQNISLSVTDTTYYWSVQTIDASLAKSTWSAEQTYVPTDNTPPTVNITVPLTGASVSGSILINSTINNSASGVNVSRVFYWLENSTGNQTAWTNITNNTAYYFNATFNTATLADGIYNVTINASDNNGNENSTESTQITIDNSGPIWSTNESTIVSPYDASTASTFKIDWTDLFSAISDVSFESNHSGSPQNYSMNLVSLGWIYDSYFSVTNSWQIGLGWNGTYWAVGEEIADEVYFYNPDGTYSGKHFDTAGAGAGTPGSISWNGTNWGVFDEADDRLYIFDPAGTHVSDFSVGVETANPIGVGNNGSVWAITDRNDDEIYFYDFAGSYTGEHFDTSATMAWPGGIEWNGSHWGISSFSNNRVYFYTAAGAYTGASFGVTIGVYDIDYNNSHWGVLRTCCTNPDRVYLYRYEEYYNYSALFTSGDYYWKSYANDTNGIMSVSDTWNFTVQQEVTPPSVTINDPSAGLVSGSILINATVTDTVTGVNASAVYYWLSNSSGNQTNWTTLSNVSSGNMSWFNATFNTSTLADGSYNVTINASDNAGNINATEYVQIDISNAATPWYQSGNISNLETCTNEEITATANITIYAGGELRTNNCNLTISPNNLNIAAEGLLNVTDSILIVNNWQTNGTTIVDPSTIWLNGDLEINNNTIWDATTVRVNCTSDGEFGINVTEAGNLTIRANSNITNGEDSADQYWFNIYGNLTATDSYISEVGWAGAEHQRELYIRGRIITDNLTLTSDYNGLLLKDADNSNVQNSSITAASSINRYALNITGDSDNNYFYGNNLTAPGSFTSHAFVVDNLSANNNNFTENIFLAKGASGAAIYLKNSSTNYFYSNNISATQHYALQLTDGANNQFENNIITGGPTSDDDAVHIDSSSNSNSFINNLINASGLSATGVHLAGLGSDNNLFSNNRIIAVGDSAVFVTTAASSNIFTANEIKSYDALSDSGVEIVTNSNNNTFYLNNITALDYGVYLHSDSVLNNFTSNNITSVDNGIYLSSANNSFTSNIVSTPGQGARLIAGADNSTFISNNITSTGGYGFQMTSVDFLNFTKNTISSSDHGLYFSFSDNNSLNQNNITSSDGRGVFLSSSDNNIFYFNIIIGGNSADHGMRVSSSTGNQFTGDIITSPSSYGLYLSNIITANNLTIDGSGANDIYSTTNQVFRNCTFGDSEYTPLGAGEYIISANHNKSNIWKFWADSQIAKSGLPSKFSSVDDVYAMADTLEIDENSDAADLTVGTNGALAITSSAILNTSGNTSILGDYYITDGQALNLTLNGTIRSHILAENVQVFDELTIPSTAGYNSINKFINLTDTAAPAWAYTNLTYIAGDLGGATEASLRLCKHDGSVWSQAPGSGVDTTANYVYANVTSFSLFGALEDTGNPVVNITAPIAGDNVSGSILINATITDGASGVDASKVFYWLENSTGNQTAWTSMSNNTYNHFNATFNTSTLADSFYNVTINASDIAGNQNATEKVQIRIDNTIPVVTLTIPIDDSWDSDGNITFNCSATAGELTSITLYHNTSGAFQQNQTNSVTGASNQTSFSVNNTQDGTYIWNCKANNTLPISRFAASNFTIHVDLDSSVDDSSTVTNSTLTNSTVQNNATVSDSTVNESTIDNSTITNSTIIDSIINQSIIDNSTVISSNITNSNVTDSTITNSTIINSTVDNSNITRSYILNSTINGSNIIDSNITDSTVTDSNVTNSNVSANSNVSNSDVQNSEISNCIVINSTVINSTKINCTLINVIQIGSTVTNSYEIDSNVTNSTIDNSSVSSSTLTDSTATDSNVSTAVAINATFISSNVTDAIINNCTINLTTIDTATTTIEDSILFQANITNNILTSGNLTYQGTVYSAPPPVDLASIFVPAGTISINLVSPAGLSESESSSVIFSYTVSSSQNVASCSLIFNDQVDQTDTSITAGATQTFAKFGLSAKYYLWSINCTDALGNQNASETRGFTVPEIITSTGGGGGYSPVVAIVSESFEAVPAARRTLFEIEDENIAAREIEFTLNKDVSEVEILISSLSSVPSNIPAPEGLVYQYLEIHAPELSRDNLKDATMSFVVPVSWIKDNNINKESIRLERYSGGRWTALETQLIADTELIITLDSKVPGFSYFAITGKTKEVLPDKREPVREDYFEVPVESKQNRSDYISIILALGIFVIIALFFTMRYKQRPSRAKTVHKPAVAKDVPKRITARNTKEENKSKEHLNWGYEK